MLVELYSQQGTHWWNQRITWKATMISLLDLARGKKKFLLSVVNSLEASHFLSHLCNCGQHLKRKLRNNTIL